MLCQYVTYDCPSAFGRDNLCYHRGYSGYVAAGFRGADRILQVFQWEQDHEENSAYRFIRKVAIATDTLLRNGKGAAVKGGTGLIWSGFRPSDDACTYGYLIPSNMFATVALGYLEEIADRVYGDNQLKAAAAHLRQQIEKGIKEYGIVETEDYGKIYAYEVDGFGQYNLMDDANIPSLLSMPYLGYRGDRGIMQSTRRFILSEANPCYYQGKYARGSAVPIRQKIMSGLWLLLCRA